MSLFDQLVDEALKNREDLAPLRSVVEKELLQHDILRVLSGAGLLAQLTFIGGTCLRICYGSNRLSEDLDFTGGENFDRKSLSEMAHILIESLQIKYGLQIDVSEPTRETGNTDTWKIKIITRPEKKDLPTQRINIDICAIPSYQSRPMMLLNPYGVEMGTSGLIVQAESREEIFVDKLIAFALRPNKIKYRDLWDMMWLHQRGVQIASELILPKLKDHHCSSEQFLSLLEQRRFQLTSDPKTKTEFQHEMRRFLPADLVSQTVNLPTFWPAFTSLIDHLCNHIITSL